eukprot:4619378-Pyramimonas_sp.AAC.1
MEKATWVLQAREAIQAEQPLPKPPVAPLIMVHAQPGAGKSVTITALCRWVTAFSKKYAKV